MTGTNHAGIARTLALPRGSRLCFVADGRSPIARNWIRHFTTRGDEVHLISSYPCEADGLQLASLNVVPAAFARFARGGSASRAQTGVSGRGTPALAQRLKSDAVSTLLPPALGWLAPFGLGRHVNQVRTLIDAIDPVLVHAMRVPFEGILAALAVERTERPLVVSIWGNDLEMWAAQYPLVGRLTRRTLRRADALHPDCVRDLELAREWGWRSSRPSAVLPGNGGIRSDVFFPRRADAPMNTADALGRFGLPNHAPLVLNARGFRNYVRNETFFRAIPVVLASRPDTIFAGVGMEGDGRALRWVRELGIADSMRLLPPVEPATIGQLFRRATIAVSPAEFDGTPNSLLEAMVCGAFPIAGDIASVREWIVNGENGFLFDPSDHRALATAVLAALGDDALRLHAAEHNARAIAERAAYEPSMQRAESLYAAAIAAAHQSSARPA